MSEDKSKTIIPKRATKTKLASSESVLKEGEIALIYPDTGPGTGAAKLVSGDGATVAKNLPIAIDGEAIDELRESLDIAKKIIPITLSLTGWKSVNGDNSAPYVQTVINEELKSSMNPDLVSMLDENATPNEQEVYNKNLAIISQGVGTVNNGSITYKVYKLPSADITIGLTRLGGVKEVETASGVDDVKVGGISVVKDKVAEIPKIPSADGLVPYEGATKDVNLGNHSLLINTNISDPNSGGASSAEINIGRASTESDDIGGLKFATKFSPGTDGFPISLIGNIRLFPDNFEIKTMAGEQGNEKGLTYTFDSSRFTIIKDNEPSGLDISSNRITGLSLPSADKDAANKKYVDDKITAIASSVATKHFFKSANISENSEWLWRVFIKKTDGSYVPLTDLVSVTPIVQGTSSDATKLRLTQNCVIEAPDDNFEKSIVGSYIIAYKNVDLTAQFTVGVQVVAPYKVTITEVIEKK